MHGANDFVKGMAFCNHPVLLDGMGLEPHFNAKEHGIAPIGCVFFEIIVDVKKKAFRVRRIVPVPVFRQDHAKTSGFGRFHGILDGHFGIAGIIGMHMGIKQHGPHPFFTR